MTWPPTPAPLGRQLDVVGVGEAMLLLHPPPPQTLATADTALIDVAGAELTVCGTVARFGGRAALLTRIGDDPAGERVLAKLRSLAVEDYLIEVDPSRPTGLFLRETPADGSRRVFYYRDKSAASAMEATDASLVPTSPAPRAVVLSGITASLGAAPRRLITTLARSLIAQGSALVLDANLRPQMPGYKDGVDALRRLLPHTSLLAVGADESHSLLGETDPQRVLHAAAEAGVKETVVKVGPDGSWILHDDKPVHVPSTAENVVDPVGAGDAYLGAYLAVRLQGQPARTAADIASDIAARTVAVLGDTTGLPSREVAQEMLLRRQR